MIFHFLFYAFLSSLKLSVMSISNFIVEGEYYLFSFFFFFKCLRDTLLLTRHNKL